MNDVTRLFRDIGLTEYETRSYLSTLKLPRSSAPTIAKVSGIPTSKIYDVLAKLIRKGFVIEEPGTPKMFKGIDPEIVLRGYLESKKESIKDLNNRINAVASKIPLINEDHGIWIIRGRDSVEKIIKKIISDTNKQLYVRCSSDEPYLRMISNNLKNIRLDFKNNSVGNNIINSDGQEMLIYLTKKEAIWIRNKKYCRIKNNSLNQGLAKYTNGEYISHT